MGTCSVEGCVPSEGSRFTAGYCNAHYLRIRKYGDPNHRVRSPKGTNLDKSCGVSGCEKPAHVRGVCSMHHSRISRNGDTEGRPRGGGPKGRTCSHAGCGRKHFAKGFCTMHYARVKKYGSASISGSKTAGSLNGICRVADCGRLVLGLALCSVHYQRLKRYGTPTPESLRAKRTPGVTTCVVIGCGDPAGTRDMCSHHYQVALRYNGNPLGGKRRNLWHTVPDDAKCKAQGCERKPKSRGLCRPHYLQAQRNEDPLRFKIYGLKRRARLALGYVCDYTTEQVQARMDYWGNKCWMCGGPFECIDHVKPIKKLGKDCPANFRPACKSCNSAKSAKWYGNRELHRFVKS